MSGTADRGTRHFKQQRWTAMANVPLVLFLLWFIITKLGLSRAEIIACFNDPFTSVGVLLALTSILWHMRLGMQVIIEDYVHDAGNFRMAMMLNNLFVAALGAVSFYAILKMSLGF
jgi:succinate dehydrogenase / fumarate reductase, membrane anchor subunit